MSSSPVIPLGGPNIPLTDANGATFILGTQLDGNGFNQLETVVVTGTTAGPGIVLTDANGANFVLGTQLDSDGNQVLEVVSTGSFVPGQLPGTKTNDNATAGNVGEFLTASTTVGSGASLVTATAANATTLALTAGDWDVWAILAINGAGVVTATAILGALSLTSATLPSTVNQTNVAYAGFNNQSFPLQMIRVSLAAPASVYMVAEMTFTAGTPRAYGIINARRAR